MRNPRPTFPFLVALALTGLLAACGGRRGATINAADLPQPSGGDAAARRAPGAEAGGQGAVTGRTLEGAPTVSGPGGTAPDGAPAGPQQPGQEQQVALGPTVETPAGPIREVEALRDVHFEFDSYALGNAAREALSYNANWMQRVPAIRVLIEGHTDERGSVSYNLALGERRAVAARDYLVTLGVPQARLSTISYGKERPADPGHTEAAWAKNRRAHFVVISQ